MQIRRFYAESLPAAMRDVRKTLGADAVILTTRNLTTSDRRIVVNGSEAKVEVTAVRESPAAAAPPPPREIERTRAESGSIAHSGAQRQARSIEMPRPRALASDPFRDAGPRERRGIGPTPPPPAPREMRPPRASRAATPQEPKQGPLQEILQQVQALQNRLSAIEGRSSAAPTAPPEPAREKSEAALRLVGRVATDLRPARLRPRELPVAAPLRAYTDIAAAPLPPRPSDLKTAAPSEANGPVAECEEKPASVCASDLPLPARQFSNHLRTQGIESVLIRRILERMHFPERCGAAAGEETGEGARKAARGTFRRFVEVAGELAAERPEGVAPGGGFGKIDLTHPRRIALVGPTGVGKTTTIAKIASHYALNRNRSVALVTLDTYRIAAAEQLRTYARLLGVPFEVVDDLSTLDATLRRFSDCDLVLVDTPGHSPADAPALGRLSSAIAGSASLEAHLVIPATLRGEEMRRVMRSFRAMRYDSLIFSKIDEATCLGEILNAWLLGGYGVSYLTMGQRVPEDLEPATIEMLCKRLVTR